MNEKSIQEKIKELTLMLLYLTSWEENTCGMKYHRSWKGYDFDVLNELAESELINNGMRSKSVTLNESGIVAAKKLLDKYNFKLKPRNGI